MIAILVFLSSSGEPAKTRGFMEGMGEEKSVCSKPFTRYYEK